MKTIVRFISSEKNVENRHFTFSGYRKHLLSGQATTFKIVAEVLVVHLCQMFDSTSHYRIVAMFVRV